MLLTLGGEKLRSKVRDIKKKEKTMKFPQLLSSIATSASAVLLASSAYLFAPQSASAFELIRGDDGAVQQILDLEVNGEFFDVEFIFDSFDNIYNGTLDFDTLEEAFVATTAIFEALGDTEATGVFGDDRFDDFFIPYRFDPSFGGVYVGTNDGEPTLELDGVGTTSTFSLPQFRPYAKFTAAATPMVSTPEPSLIFAFITLSGLMLGSKRKAKG
ncbi:MAG: hypothetical protein AAGJ08_15415 [Cyanobacteria bacterium P01_H01_bin.35]